MKWEDEGHENHVLLFHVTLGVRETHVCMACRGVSYRAQEVFDMSEFDPLRIHAKQQIYQFLGAKRMPYP
jgi:hypothetical protein